MYELQIKENINLPDVKSFQDNYTNTLYKRPFLLEKIKKDIYRGQHYNLLKSNNSDKHLLKLKKTLKKKVKIINPIVSNLSASNNYDHLYKYIGKLNNNSKLKSIKNKINIIPTKRILRRQRSDFDLPTINSRQVRKIPLLKNNNRTMILVNDNSKAKNQENITNNELLDNNDIYNFKPRMIKIGSFINSSRIPDLSINNEKKIYDMNEINDKYNLKLNLGNTNKKTSNIFHGKRYTIIGMLNKLFHYYSSSESHNNMLSNFDNNQTTIYLNNSKNQNYKECLNYYR